MHIVYAKLGQADAGDNEAKLITKLAPEWVRTQRVGRRGRGKTAGGGGGGVEGRRRQGESVGGMEEGHFRYLFYDPLDPAGVCKLTHISLSIQAVLIDMPDSSSASAPQINFVLTRLSGRWYAYRLITSLP